MAENSKNSNSFDPALIQRDITDNVAKNFAASMIGDASPINNGVAKVRQGAPGVAQDESVTAPLQMHIHQVDLSTFKVDNETNKNRILLGLLSENQAVVTREGNSTNGATYRISLTDETAEKNIKGAVNVIDSQAGYDQGLVTTNSIALKRALNAHIEATKAHKSHNVRLG